MFQIKCVICVTFLSYIISYQSNSTGNRSQSPSNISSLAACQTIHFEDKQTHITRWSGMITPQNPVLRRPAPSSAWHKHRRWRNRRYIRPWARAGLSYQPAGPSPICPLNVKLKRQMATSCRRSHWTAAPFVEMQGLFPFSQRVPFDTVRKTQAGVFRLSYFCSVANFTASLFVAV